MLKIFSLKKIKIKTVLIISISTLLNMLKCAIWHESKLKIFLNNVSKHVEKRLMVPIII